MTDFEQLCRVTEVALWAGLVLNLVAAGHLVTRQTGARAALLLLFIGVAQGALALQWH